MQTFRYCSSSAKYITLLLLSAAPGGGIFDRELSLLLLALKPTRQAGCKLAEIDGREKLPKYDEKKLCRGDTLLQAEIESRRQFHKKFRGQIDLRQGIPDRKYELLKELSNFSS
jgi:hypothetical protein